MKDEKHIYKPGYKSTQYIDEWTTAERSVVNARRIDGIDEVIDFVGSVITPENLEFGDKTLVSTQATRAEDIVSVEDVRLQGEIDGKVNIASYVVEQDAQDVLIASNTADIASNDTDIADLQSDVAVIESELDVINQELQAQAAFDVTSTAKDIQQDNRLDNLESKDVQQDNRLDIIEGEIGQVGVTSSVYSDTVATFSSTTPTTITPSITTDFTALNLAENDFVDQAAMSVIVKEASQVRFDFNYTLEQITGTAVKFTVDLYNVTQGVLIDTNTVSFDFSGSVNQLSGNQFNLGEVAKGDVITVMVYVDTGSVAITQAKGLFTITTLAAIGSDSVYDYNVISTSDIGGATTLDDINYLNSNKVTGITYSGGVNTTLSTGSGGFEISGVSDDIIVSAANFDSRTFSGMDTDTKTMIGAINELNNKLEALVPIGTIQLGVTAPAFGTWADLGVLAEGQSIIGSRPDGDGNNTVADGTSYSGAVKSHNHIWSTGYGFGDGGGSARKFINHLTTYNSDDTETSISDSSEDTAKNVYTKKTGSSNNIAYGKQIGYNIHVWKRTA